MRFGPFHDGLSQWMLRATLERCGQGKNVSFGHIAKGNCIGQFWLAHR